MKKRTVTVVLAWSIIATGILAQAKSQRNSELTPQQREEIQAVKAKYAPEIAKIKGELRFAMTEQRILLNSKTIDEQAVYANIDKVGQLKMQMQKQNLSMREEVQKMCPLKNQRQWMHSEGHQNRGGQGKTMQKGQEQRPRNAQACAKNAGDAATCPAGGKQGMSNNKRRPCPEMRREGAAKDCPLNLSDTQKEQMAAVKKAHFWKIQETKNKLSLLKAKNTDIDKQLNALSEVNALQTQLEKQKMAVKLEKMKILTEEQRIKMMSQRGQKQRKEKGGRGGRA